MQFLALHGFTGRGSDFAPLVQGIGGDWHCPDLPGHGPEPRLDCSPVATEAFVEGESERTFGSDSNIPTILIGYSMGARAALNHALQHPNRYSACILISPNPGIEAPQDRQARREVDAKLAHRIEVAGVEAFLEFWQNTPMIRSQQAIPKNWLEAMQQARRLHTPTGLATSLREFGQGVTPNLWPELPLLKMPSILLTGKSDIKYTQIANRMVQEHSQLVHHEIADAGHAPHLEHADAVLEILKNFLAQF